MPLPEAPVDRDWAVDEVIRSIQGNKLESLDTVLATEKNMPGRSGLCRWGPGDAVPSVGVRAGDGKRR